MQESQNENLEKNIQKINKIVFSSAHINLLFGAGVNGNAFPQMKDFIKTRDYLTKNLTDPTYNFEIDMNSLSDTKKKNAFNIFHKELKLFANEVDINNPSIKNIEEMFSEINKLVLETENRTNTTKQINIYTLNYDLIVEQAINRLGFLCNVISSTNITSHDKFFEMIGYDYSKKRFMPTYLVSKIHGDLENPVLPSNRKYDEILQAKRFEIFFKMKSQLSRMNSILFVIGYSGNDGHLNTILKDCIATGLTIYWFRYDKSNELPNEFIDKVNLIDQPNEDGDKKNMTEVCRDMVKNSWAK
ncbi:MAG: SIR2 family protein [Erysipelotrichales bacterium]|nr:SIR2 family protein [Erysipelotrichales bacterium]